MTGLEMLKLLPEAFKKDAAGNAHAIMQYEISTPAYVEIADGTCKVTEGTHQNPTVTLKMSDETLIATMTGKMNPMMAFLTGKLKATGDLAASQKLQAVFDTAKLTKEVKAASAK